MAKRKHVSMDNQTPPLRDIKSFASVRKAQQQPDELAKKRKTVHGRSLTPPPPPVKASRGGRKRKHVDEDQEIEEVAVKSPTPDQAEPLALQPPNDVRRPDSKRTKTQHLPSVQTTPSKKTAALFERLALSGKVAPLSFAPKLSTSTRSEDDSSEAQADSEQPDWPEELDTLSQLNAAFLSALSLYYAHNGASSAADAGALLRMITDTWKVRKVSLDDIRMLLAVGHVDEEEGFVLQDYGRGGIRLARLGPRGRAIKRTNGFVDEANLNKRFQSSLGKQWRDWLGSTAQENRDVQRFIKQLPLAEVTLHESTETAASLFARGDQRLADLKATRAAANATPSPDTSVDKAKPSQDNETRGTTLLNRILAKQALHSSLPAEPTKAQLERKAALQRVEGVARTLAMLAAGRPRCSFSLSAVTQHLQQSMRSPISSEEAQSCLEVMAKEITPGFVSVVQNGNVKFVTVARSCQVDLVEIRRRVEIAQMT